MGKPRLRREDIKRDSTFAAEYKKMEETRKGWGSREVKYLSGQGPVRAVAPLKKKIWCVFTLPDSGMHNSLCIFCQSVLLRVAAVILPFRTQTVHEMVDSFLAASVRYSV